MPDIDPLVAALESAIERRVDVEWDYCLANTVPNATGVSPGRIVLEVARAEAGLENVIRQLTERLNAAGPATVAIDPMAWARAVDIIREMIRGSKKSFGTSQIQAVQIARALEDANLLTRQLTERLNAAVPGTDQSLVELVDALIGEVRQVKRESYDDPFDDPEVDRLRQAILTHRTVPADQIVNAAVDVALSDEAIGEWLGDEQSFDTLRSLVKSAIVAALADQTDAV